MLPLQNTLELIPQAPPFVMVDALLHADELTSRSSFIIQPDNFMVQNGCFTEGGLLENIAQTAAAHAGYMAKQNNQPVAGGFIAAVKDFEIGFLPQVGEEIMTEIKIENQFFNVSVVKGNVWCNKQLAATCEIKVVINEEAS